MELLTDNPWRIAILTPVKNEADIDEDPVWIELDGEMVKLGSLEHESLNIPQVQQKALTLLSTKSKDVRIMAHFLRTLQHSGKAAELLLGLALFADYVETCWTDAPPKGVKKIRLGQQILKRFENMATNFNRSASRLEKDEARVQLERLKQCWTEPTLLDEIELLSTRYTFIDAPIAEEAEIIVGKSVSPVANDVVASNIPISQTIVIEPIEIDQSNDKAWRNTLLKVAEYLVNKDAAESVGYQLRRYAIWHNITSAPPAENNKTQLAAISADRVAEYKAALENADINLWQEVEYSLTLAPFWFEGHQLSAEIANRLGYMKVAVAIKESLNNFLDKLPILRKLTFSDNTPFLPETCYQWLSQTNTTDNILHNNVNDINGSIETYYEERGLEETLKLINEQTYSDMREKVYAQLQSINLLNKCGLHSLAKQYYATLQASLEVVLVKDWEPSLFSLLTKEQGRN
ncbi:type VI secretion system protein TssA [Pasteurellaceae bacterium LIM206]|nr:type VI secretion system protein TssA [Pasteurellaceae bacterium LIM206]